MGMYDVTIIGAGVVGTAIARELSKYKLKIVLLEKEEELAFGVSKSNSGIVHPGTQNDPNSLKGKLCVQGNRLTKELSRELGVDYREVGELIVAFSEEDIRELERLKKDAEILGVPGLEIVDREWLKEREPHLNPDVVAALYAPTAGIVSPYRLAYDLCENAIRNGLEVHTSRKVEKIIPMEEGKNRFFEVHTPGETYRTRFVVNSAGLYSDEISGMVGIDDFKITPRKGEEFLLDKKLAHLTNHLIFPLPTKVSKGVLAIKTADGNPMVGPTAEDVEDKEDLSTTDEGLEKVLSSVKKLVPAIDGRDIIAYFAGLRPSAGHDFIIRHEDKVPGFVTVAGIQSPGLTSAPAIALMVCDLLKGAGLKMRKKFIFHGHRKKTVHLFETSFKETEKLIKKDHSYGDILCRCEMVSRKEVEDAIDRGARTLDGIKFRTRAQAGRCHGGFCTTRIMRVLSEKTKVPLTEVSKRGKGSEIVKGDRDDG